MDKIVGDKGILHNAVEIRFADEARVGQKNKITKRWARRGTRPSTPQDQRTAATYIFGAICPREGKCPELRPVENLWQFMRDKWLSNRVFQSYDTILDHYCEA